MATISGGAGAGMKIPEAISAAGSSNIGTAIIVIAALYLIGEFIKSEGESEWPIDVDDMQDGE